MMPAGSTSSYRLVGCVLLLASFLLLCAAASTSGQTITSPAPGTRLKAGDDYATTVLGDPWDMRNVEDVAQFPLGTQGFLPGFGFGPNGWSGTTSGFAFLTLLFQGFEPHLALASGRFGVNFPIDAGRYRKLTMKFNTTRANFIGFFWFRDQKQPSAQTGFGRGGYTSSGPQVLSVDLPSTAEPGYPADWSGSILGFRIDPNTFDGTPGVPFELNWVRLTAGDVTTPVTWSGAPSTAVVEAVDSTGLVVSRIGQGAQGNVSWAYDGLPPGAYTIRIRNGNSTLRSNAITINDPPIVHLTDPDETGGADYATVELGNPWDMNGSPDVAGVLGIDNSTIRYTIDDGRTVFAGVSLPAVAGVSEGDSQVFLNNYNRPPIDAARYHRVSFRMKVLYDSPSDWVTTRILFGKDNASVITHGMSFLVWNNEYRTFASDMAKWKVGDGLEPCCSFAGDWSGLIRMFRLDPLEYPQATQFFIDEVKLAADDETSASGTFTIRWNATDKDAADNPTLALYYDTDLDPGNGMAAIASGLSAASGSYVWNAAGVAPGTYHIYAVISDGRNSQGRYSTGPIVVRTPTGPVFHNLTTAVAGNGRLNLSPAGTSCGTGCTAYPAGTVVSLAPLAGSGSAFAGFSGHPDCLDGQVTMQLSLSCTANFTTLVAPGLVQPGIADMNGDGGGDVIRHNPVTGAWVVGFSNRAGGFAERTGTWLPGERLYPGDFNGDGVTDVFRFNSATGQWRKCFNDGLGGFNCVAGSWDPGWEVHVGDYSGDGRADVFVYNVATGVWVNCLTTGGDASGFSYVAGRWDPAWQVYPLDLDGNGRTDLFLYNDRTGVWFRAMSNGAGNFAYVSGIWQIRGWEVHSGDFNADGRGDLFIYNRSNGNWFVCINSGSGFAYRMGSWSPGWTVETGDMNGDGRTDVFVYEPVSGLWFQCFYNNSFTYSGGRWDPAWQPHVTELNGDGYADVLVYNPATGLYFQCLSLAGGGFRYGAGNWGPGWTIVAKGPRW
ncbi:MAG: FG-GAP repeat domain-containing protein [Vicinamibacterales bacterium]